MSPPASKHVVNVAGLPVNVYGLSELRPGAPDAIAALILVHGIGADAFRIEETALEVFQCARERGRVFGRARRDFIVVSFDIRNHGFRLVDPRANRPWHRSTGDNINKTYAYAVPLPQLSSPKANQPVQNGCCRDCMYARSVKDGWRQSLTPRNRWHSAGHILHH